MFKKNTAVTGFAFCLVSKTDGSAVTSGTTTGYVTIDGGSQTAIAGTPTHEGNGQWSVNLAQAEMNGDVIGLLFVNTSAVPAHFTIKTDTAIVSEVKTVVDGTAAKVIGTIATGTHNPQSGDAYARIGSTGSGLTTLATQGSVDSIAGNITNMQSDLGTIDGLVDAVKAKTDNLPASPAAVGSAMTLTAAYDAAKTAASQTTADAILVDTGTTIPAQLSGIETLIGDVQTTADSIYGKVSNLSISNRLSTTIPASIVRATSGDKYVKFDVWLTDVDGNSFDSRDSDGGNWSNNSHYNLNDRVKPTTGNAGGYFFQLTTLVESASTVTQPDWSTVQTQGNTIVDALGNTWTNIGTTTSVTLNYNGFGITVSDENGNDWTLYADNVGTPLGTINQCSHHGATSIPQVLKRSATGAYYFYANVDDAEAPRNINFHIAWFDLARWEAGYSSAYHKREVMQMHVDEYFTMTPEGIASAVWDDTTASHTTTGTFGGSVALAGGQMDLVNAPNATAIAAIQHNLSTFKPDVDTVVNVTNVATVAGMPTASEVADAVLDEVYEGSTTLRQLLRGVASVLMGKSAGGGTTTITFRDSADAKNRIDATVDSNGNRTSVTLDLT